MKFLPSLLTAFGCLTSLAHAAVPPAEKLLPPDTLFFVTVPDWAKARAARELSPTVQFWRDPEMKPFREKFLDRLQTDLLTPLEGELGVKLADYAALGQGQLTFALTQLNLDPRTNQAPGWVLLLDTRDQSDLLKKNLGELKKKWVEAGRAIRSEKIRDLEFSTLVIGSNDYPRALKNLFPEVNSGDDTKSARPFELVIGQSESLLLVAGSTRDLEQILVRQAGGTLPALAEQPAFEANQNTLFRDALAFGWINPQPIVAAVKAAQAAAAPSPRNRQPFRADRVLDALGLNAVKAVAFSVQLNADGTLLRFAVTAPEAERRGIAKLFAFEAREAAPPPFVPAHVAKFGRWRPNGAKTWATLEAMIKDLSPETSGVIQMMLGAVGKDKDPAFDFKATLIGNLGDDFISYQRAPRSASLADLDTPPQLVLIGSPNPEQLLKAFKVGATLLPVEGELKEREFLGRKIFSLPMQSGPGLDGAKPGERQLHFAAGNGYLALSPDAGMVEDFLRGADSQGKPLRDVPGLAATSEKVGGQGTGWFTYDNHAETSRVMFDALRQRPDALSLLIPPEQFFLMKQYKLDGVVQFLVSRCDFSLLPAFDKVARYYSFTVCTGAANAAGLDFKIFSPTPAELKK